MRNVLVLLAAAVVGAGGFWAYQRWTGARNGPGADPGRKTADVQPGRSATPDAPDTPIAPGASAVETPVAREPAPAPVFAKRPIFFEGDGQRKEESSARTAPAPAGTADSGSAKLAPGGALDADRDLARTAFDSGDRKRGIRLLEELFQSAKDRPDVDLSADVSRLLEAESRLAQKREYLLYLARFDRTGRVLEDQLNRATKKILVAEDSPEAAVAAWDELTLAHDVAQDRAQRKRVLGQVEPFLLRMVFSNRFTPLLNSYMIQPGDSLSQIASKFQTTQDSMRRLNGLKGEVIQPRQRLRILPGKLKIFVDKSDFTLWATLDDRIFLEFQVGTGRDNATPVGAFAIRVRQKDPTWWRPGETPILAGDPKNILGTRWLGFEETKDFAGFGIHGTTDPSSLGKESSAGCIRMRNEDIELLYDFVTLGTEVQIRP